MSRNLGKCSYGVLLHDVWSNSWRNSSYLVSNKIEIDPGILGLVARRIACPLLVCFGWTFLLITSSTIALSVCIGVGGCLCPISSTMMWMYTASLAMMYSAAVSASVADDMTCLIMCAMLRMTPLFVGTT